jgi:hypothetical protein
VHTEAGHVERARIVGNVRGDSSPNDLENGSVVLGEVLAFSREVDVSVQSYRLKVINEDLSSKELLLPESIARVFDDFGVIAKGL